MRRRSRICPGYVRQAFLHYQFLPCLMICCIITWAAAELYQRYQREQKEIRRINEQNKTVEEILKTKKGSIKRSPLPPNGPNRDVILNMTLEEIQALAKKEPSKWHEIYKLLTDGRFNR